MHPYTASSTQWVNERGGLPYVAGLEASASLLGLLHSPGVTHPKYSVTTYQPLQLVLGPAVSALRAQGDLDEPAQATHPYPRCLDGAAGGRPVPRGFKPYAIAHADKSAASHQALQMVLCSALKRLWCAGGS